MKINHVQESLSVLVLACVIFLINGCYKTQLSNVMEEPGHVIELHFVPSHTESILVPKFDSEGHVSLEWEDCFVPDFFAVTFSCTHGNFIIKGSSEFNALLWKRMYVGDKVRITYQENYHAFKHETNFYKFNFIDAVQGEVHSEK